MHHLTVVELPIWPQIALQLEAFEKIENVMILAENVMCEVGTVDSNQRHRGCN